VKRTVCLVLLGAGISGSVALADSIGCHVQNDAIEKIVCTYKTARKNVDRNVTFLWHSRSYPQDDRERTIVLPALHGSVYDYRYLRGRAQGVWKVVATLEEPDGSTKETEHHFLLENDRLIEEE